MQTMTDAAPAPDRQAVMRSAMVASQLRPNAVNDPVLLAAMGATPREAFLPASVAAQAYRDTRLTLDGGRMINPPTTTARLLNEAALRPGDKVLLIGAAGGYTAAVIARCGATVVAVESDPALIALAQHALTGTPGVMLIEGPLELGHAATAPHDVLVIDGAVDKVPEVLIDQVAVGGRLVTGVIDRGVTRLAVGRRTAGGVGLMDFADVDCVPLPGFSASKQFVF